jgi:hypothetical protein
MKVKVKGASEWAMKAQRGVDMSLYSFFNPCTTINVLK